MVNNCSLCNMSLYDPDNVEYLKGAYLMPCCNTVVHRNCIVEYVRSEVGLGNTPECPNEKCRKDIDQEKLPGRTIKLLDRAIATLPFAVTLLSFGCLSIPYRRS